MKRTDTQTLILPGFLELVRNDAGVSKIEVKGEIRTCAAAQLIGCSVNTVIRLIESGAIHGRRLTDRPNSLYVVCGDCCSSWRLIQSRCDQHRSDPRPAA